MPDQTEPPVVGTHNGFEIYPMPMFATMQTRDVNALSQWYQAALGFAVMFEGPEIDGQPVLIHLRRRKYQDVLLKLAHSTGPAPQMTGLSIYFQAGESVDAIATRAAAITAPGIAAVQSPTNTHWSTREVQITDPDGR
ncbi:MAG TPA: VOC family protein, partial [Steroidobacteraceae bacterium]|nr:VOC family protein [Steroidobacteraceae bacterium]